MNYILINKMICNEKMFIIEALPLYKFVFVY